MSSERESAGPAASGDTDGDEGEGQAEGGRAASAGGADRDSKRRGGDDAGGDAKRARETGRHIGAKGPQKRLK